MCQTRSRKCVIFTRSTLFFIGFVSAFLPLGSLESSTERSVDLSSSTPVARTHHVPGPSSKKNDDDPPDFAKLHLVEQELWGSRWAIEQNKRINVHHSVEIVDATLQDKGQLSLRIEFYIRQRWVADGLEFPKGLFKDTDSNDQFLTVKDSVLKYMWNPNAYISTSRQSSISISGAPINVVNIYRNNTIHFRARLFTSVACSSNFKWFPLDKQACHLQIDSYKYCDKYVRYLWDDNFQKPLITKIDQLMQYDVASATTENGTRTRGGRGEQYPYVRVRLEFERRLGNIMMTVFIPTILVISLSWFSFWLGLDAVPARSTLLVTCMLTLITMHISMKAAGPLVHYVTMMDVWTVTCITFVFAAICQFVVVKFMVWRYHLQLLESDSVEILERNDENYDTLYEKSPHPSILHAKRTFSKFSKDSQGNTLYTIESGSTLNTVGTRQNAHHHHHHHHNNIIGTTQNVEQEEKKSTRIEMSTQTNQSWRINPSQSSYSSLPQEDVDDKKCQCKLWVWCKSKYKNYLYRLKPWDKIDKICRILFPLAFFIFNCLYWTILIKGSGDQIIEINETNEVFSQK